MHSVIVNAGPGFRTVVGIGNGLECTFLTFSELIGR